MEYYVPYRRAVEAAGAEPVDLVPGTKALPELDGLLLPGGWDVDPSFYGERRDEKVGQTDPELDETELTLFRQARERELPVLGICRGQQVINVALGGSLVQHLDDHDARAIGRTHLAHTIEVDPSSELGRAAGEHRGQVDADLGPRLGALGDRDVEAEAKRLAYALDPHGLIRHLERAACDRRVGLRPAPDAAPTTPFEPAPNPSSTSGNARAR